MVRVLIEACQLDAVEVFLEKMVVKFSVPPDRQKMVKKGILNTYTAEIIDDKTFIFYFKDHEKFINEFIENFEQK